MPINAGAVERALDVLRAERRQVKWSIVRAFEHIRRARIPFPMLGESLDNDREKVDGTAARFSFRRAFNTMPVVRCTFSWLPSTSDHFNPLNSASDSPVQAASVTATRAVPVNVASMTSTSLSEYACVGALFCPFGISVFSIGFTPSSAPIRFA